MRLYDYQHGRHFFGEIHGVRKGLWAFFLDCAFGMLIGWAGKLGSRGMNFTGTCQSHAMWWHHLCTVLYRARQAIPICKGVPCCGYPGISLDRSHSTWAQLFNWEDRFYFYSLSAIHLYDLYRMHIITAYVTKAQKQRDEGCAVFGIRGTWKQDRTCQYHAMWWHHLCTVLYRTRQAIPIS